MAKSTGPMFSLSASGTLAGVLCFTSNRSGTTIKRASRPTGAPSTAQQQQRDRYAAAVAAWHQLTTEQKDALKPAADAARLSPYSFHLKTYLSTPAAPAGTPWDGGTSTWDGGASTWD